MTKFLILYRAQVSASDQMSAATPEEAKAGMDAWTTWAERTGPALINRGSPLTSRTTLGGAPGPGHFGGYSVLEAADLAAAEALLAGHPHLHAPGFTIEILQITPIAAAA